MHIGVSLISASRTRSMVPILIWDLRRRLPKLKVFLLAAIDITSYAIFYEFIAVDALVEAVCLLLNINFIVI